MSRLVGIAWDHERPHKRPPRLGHEAAWRDELVGAGYRPDPERVLARMPVALEDLKVQRIASRAVDRCAAMASTWTVHDLQEQVTRLVTDAGVRAAPAALRGFVDLTTRLAVEGCLSVLPPDAVRPEHVAHLTSLHVVAVETRLRDLLTARATAASGRVSERVLIGQGRGLDVDQAKAAEAIASTDPLVVVEGAAGSGKTTMLAAAIHAADDEGRRVRVLAPTKKAADVARQELDVASDSVAKLVHEHGWRWNSDGVWTLLHSGETDPLTGAIYRGPSEAARLVPGQRIVVDEAGMLDQDTALALLTVADEQGATLALVGDRAQLAAVGRGGVLDIAADLAPHVYDVGTVHRFTDPDYADLTLQLRHGDHPVALFERLHRLGLISLHDSEQALHDAIAHDARDGEAITVATNGEARELNARIREERARTGQVDDTRTTTGSDGLPIGRGDVIQTRRNDPDLHVANRQTWAVQTIGDDGSVWATERGTGRKQHRTVHLPAEYVAEHTHLAYASTAYGVQGATVSASHTVLSEALDASSVYVGMTRGRDSNRLHLVAADVDDAREQFSTALERDRADRGVVAATRVAHGAVTGLIADGPVAVINTERARLEKVIEEALHEASAWEQAVAEFDQLRETYSSERARRQEAVVDADAGAARIRGDVVVPLLKAATADGAAYLAAREVMWNTTAAHSRAGLLAKRGAGRVAAKAAEECRATETAVFGRWGALPHESTRLERWAEAVAANIADAQPAVVEAKRAAAREHGELNSLDGWYLMDFVAERRRLLGDTSPTGAVRRIAELRAAARQATRDLTTIETMPLADAVEFIRERAARAAAEQEVADRAREMRASRAAQPAQPRSLADDGRVPWGGGGFGAF